MIWARLLGHFDSRPNERVSFPGPSRAPAICPPPRTRKVARRELAVRRDNRNVHSSAAVIRRLAQRWNAGLRDSHADTNALRDAPGSLTPGPLFAASRSTYRISRTRSP